MFSSLVKMSAAHPVRLLYNVLFWKNNPDDATVMSSGFHTTFPLHSRWRLLLFSTLSGKFD